MNWSLNNRVHTAGCLRCLSVVLLWQDNKLFTLSVWFSVQLEMSLNKKRKRKKVVRKVVNVGCWNIGGG